MANKRPRAQWVHPTMPRYYVCSGVRTLASVLDQTTDERVSYHDSWDAASIEAKRLNSDAGDDGLPWAPHMADEADQRAEVEAIMATPLVGALHRFAAVGSNVYYGSDICGHMKSHTFAKRTANALNNHRTNKEGV